MIGGPAISDSSQEVAIPVSAHIWGVSQNPSTRGRLRGSSISGMHDVELAERDLGEDEDAGAQPVSLSIFRLPHKARTSETTRKNAIS